MKLILAPVVHLRRKAALHAVIFAGSLLLAASSAQALSGSAAVTVTKGLMESCIKSMKANQTGSGLTDDKINGFCSCSATKTAEELQVGEVQRYFYSNGQATVRMRDMNARIGRECQSRYLR
jgi:hypothetical protein